MKMVEHIDSLTFGPSLNESESPVNNFSSPALSLIYRHRGAFLSLASRRRRKGRVIEKKKEKKRRNLSRHPGWDSSLICWIHFTFPSVENWKLSQISSMKQDYTLNQRQTVFKCLFLSLNYIFWTQTLFFLCNGYFLKRVLCAGVYPGKWEGCIPAPVGWGQVFHCCVSLWTT